MWAGTSQLPPTNAEHNQLFLVKTLPFVPQSQIS